MSVDRSKLEKFLDNNGVSAADAKAAMKTLDCLFRQAERGEFAFAAVPDAAEAASVIGRVTAECVKKVVFVSAADRRAIAACLGDRALHRGLWHRLREPGLWESLSAGLSDKLHVAVTESLGAGLGESLLPALGIRQHDPKTWADPANPAFDVLWFNLGNCLCNFLAFTLTGNKGRAAEYAALVRLLARTPPLLEKAGDPGIWFALKA